MSQFLRRIPFHPFLWAIYPILSLLASNLGQVYLWMGLRSMVLSLTACGLILVALRLAYGDWPRAALPTSLMMLIIFSYGHIYPSIEDATILGFNIGRHRFLLALLAVLLAAVIIWLFRRPRGSLGSVTQAVNIIALVLVAFPLVQIARYQITQASVRQAASETESTTTEMEGLSSLALPSDKPAPDVYFIILDAYGREDTLRKYFGYDNLTFLERLEELGFHVARCSQSNYSVTEFSIASALNMDYLEMGEDALGSTSDLGEMISHSAARQAFEQLGYTSVAFESGYGLTEVKDADIYYSPNLHPGLANYLGGINAFEALLLRTSIGFLIYERFETLPDNIKTMLSTAYAEHRTRILYTFDSIEQVSSRDEPKFVFAHILAPHNPFVFGADGQLVVRSTPFTLNHDPESSDPAEYAAGYTNQITYINQRTEKLVETILENAPTPPVIILAGDHGPMLRATSADARMTNLIAIYLPPGSGIEDRLYETITPVNIFRAILDGAFNAELGRIEDRSYFGSRSSDADQFTIIPNTCH
jgi:hypothetical protein